MQIKVNFLTPCCGDQPSLDTWDQNEMRSVRCIHCDRHTESHFMRHFAYDEWEKLMAERNAKLNDWTAKDGRSNCSDDFIRLVNEVDKLIRNSAHDLICGDSISVAGLIMAQLAHKHKMTIQHKSPPPPCVTISDST